jgi:Protein of unknown function (DUF1091)
MWNQSDLTRFNASLYLKSKVQKVFATILMKSKLPDRESYDLLLFRETIETCKVMEGSVQRFFMKNFMDNFQNHSNYKFECPQSTGLYYAIDFPFASTVYQPTNILGHRVGFTMYWEFTVVVRGKIRALKTLVPMFTVTVEGSRVL